MAAYRICFVCLGNICRSPTAEVVFRAMLRDEGLTESVHVDSAGTGDWHVGEGADDRALEALAGRGYDGSEHRARQFASGWFAGYDLVLAMDASNAADLRRLAPDRRAAHKVRMLREFDPDADGLDVPDPYFGDHGFDRVLDMVEAACQGLLDHVRREVGG